MDATYNKHYIRVDAEERVVIGFSDAFATPQDGDICINEQDGYQFRLFPNGEENPLLTDTTGAHLWRWEKGVIRAATPDELETERAEFLQPSTPPTLDQRTAALEAAMLAMMGGGLDV